jgi:glycosyltransferase involved in cell wall biosynthesis
MRKCATTIKRGLMALVIWLVVEVAGSLISRMPRKSPKHPILWRGDWLPTHNNIRQAELLPRFSLVKTVYHTLPPPQQRASLASLPGRLTYFWRTHVKLPFLFKIWSRRYQILWCTSKTLEQMPLFDGPVIVDEDDPIFSTERMALLNRQYVRCVVTTTELLKQQFIRHGLQKPCIVISSGVSIGRFDPVRVTQLRRELCPDEEVMVIGYSLPNIYTDNDSYVQKDSIVNGTLRSISFLIDVMSIIWQYSDYVQLWLIGNPSDTVRNYADMHPRCRLLGYVDHDVILDYVGAFDIAVYPRVIDMFGRFSIKVIEYMAMGLPIVSTNVSEAMPAREAKAGLFADTPLEFAQHLITLVESAALRQQLGENGRRYARSYDWDRLAKQYEAEIFRRYL